MKFSILTLAILFLNIFSLAANGDNGKKHRNSNFSGEIKYVQYTPFDTTYYTVYVSKDKIRIDSFNNKEQKKAQKIMIYDLKAQKIIALKPSEKIFKLTDAKFSSSEKIRGSYVIINRRNTKYINGYKCIQYRVKNRIEDTDITYWIPENSFPFYYEMVSIKNSMQKAQKYFFMLPNHEIAFPMQTVERNTLREERLSYSVVKIDKKPIEDTLFIVPENYVLND